MNPNALTIEAGASLRRWREELGITLAQLAEQTDITAGTLSRFERGERVLAPNTYAHVIAALAVLTEQRRQEPAA